MFSGAVARNEAGLTSDVELLIEVDEPMGLLLIWSSVAPGSMEGWSRPRNRGGPRALSQALPDSAQLEERGGRDLWRTKPRGPISAVQAIA